jgi:hypothetical protein
MPEKAYVQPIPYRDKMPIMQEWRRLNDRNALTGPPKLFFRETKPPEEFYDTLDDPHEIDNLINAREHQDRVSNMRGDLERWIRETGDLGGIPENDLIERMWPGKKQPVTAKPDIEVRAAKENRRLVTIRCGTEGASIGYRLNKNGPWLLYSGPFESKGAAVLQAKCIRIGYKESERVTAHLE